jgi:hypothetical protein
MNWKTRSATRVAPRNEAPAAASWDFLEGDEIAPGRYAVRLLGGGQRFEAYLGWDDRLLALVVVKVLRPDQVDDPAALAALAAEADTLERLRHPICRVASRRDHARRAAISARTAASCSTAKSRSAISCSAET